jgi:hypothetical protein
MKTSNKGAALVIVLLIIVLLTGLGLLGIYLSQTSTRMVGNINLATEAQMVAESGLDRAQAVLFDHTLPSITVILSGTGRPEDDIPSDPSRCSEAHGAILIDYRQNPPHPLVNIPSPPIDRNLDLPVESGLVSPSMGTFTVWIRQDQVDCRSGNYLCDYAHDSEECSSPSNAPTPNGYVVVRSEAIGKDGITKAIVEKTVYLRTPSMSGTGGSTGVGGIGGTVEGTGGDLGIGGFSISLGGSTGAGSSTGAGGNTCPVTLPCMLYAVQAVNSCSGSKRGCIAINSGSHVDGYHSSAGPPGPGNQMPANIAMRCSSGGASACPNNCPFGCITGSIVYGQASPYDANTLPVPSHTPNSTYLASPPALAVNPTGNVTYIEQMDVNGPATIASGLYIINRLNLNPSGTLTINDSGGPVVIWVLSDLSPSSNVSVTSGNPMHFWLVYNGASDVNNNTNNDFTGVLFAPVAQVNLNYKVKGAVIGGKVTLNSLSAVHFDLDLKCP